MDFPQIAQQVATFLASGQADFVGGVASSTVISLIGWASGRVRRRFQPTPKRAALEDTLERALVATFIDFQDRPLLMEHLITLFGAWTEEEEVLNQLSLLIEPRHNETLNVERLTTHFSERHDVTTLPFDPGERIARFADMFYRFARINRELIDDGTLEIDLLQQMVAALQMAQTDRRAIRHAVEKLANPPDPYQLAVNAYLERLVKECNDLPDLAALGVDNSDLRYRLDQVYVPLRVRMRGNQDDIDAFHSADEPSATLFLKAVGERDAGAMRETASHRRVVLLGDPGSGKSVFVRHLASRLALSWLGHEPPPDGWSRRIPLVMTVRLLGPRLAQLDLAGLSATAQRDALRDALFAQWRDELARLRRIELGDHLETLLGSGDVVLIFDGLDEIGSNVRPLLYHAIHALERWFDILPHIIVTCRVRSYPTDDPKKLLLPGYQTLGLAPFDEDQIDTFIERWYRLAPAGMDVSGRIADLQRHAVRRDLIRLAENPLLLTAMAVVHQKRTRLPDQRVKIYAEVVDILLVRWQKTRGLAVSDELAALLENRDGQNRVLKSMERLGYEAHCLLGPDNESGDLTRSAIRAMLSEPDYLGDAALVDAFLDYIDQRAGLLLGRGGDEALGLPAHYGFPHRTFLEYLAGCYLLKDHLRATKEMYSALTADANDWHVAAYLGAEELIYNRRSEGAARELAYHLIAPAMPARQSEWRAAVWAGHIASHVGRAALEQDTLFHGAHHLKHLIDYLTRIVTDSQTLPIQERAEAGNWLAALGDPREGVCTTIEHNGIHIPLIAWGGEVPAASYQVGGDSRAYSTFKAQTVTIKKPYRLARYPVTYFHFECFRTADDVNDERWWAGMPAEGEAYSTRYQLREWSDQAWPIDNRPRERVSWYQAIAFCRWLDHHLKAAGKMTDEEEIDLPTEYEWEVAARYAGEGRVDGRTYPWDGDTISPAHANYSSTNLQETSAVGLFPDGRQPHLDLCDLSGNVWEWCRNKYSDPDATQLDQSNASRTLRGGSWGNYHDGARAACRYDGHPHYRDSNVGRRLVVRRPPSHDH